MGVALSSTQNVRFITLARYHDELQSVNREWIRVCTSGVYFTKLFSIVQYWTVLYNTLRNKMAHDYIYRRHC